MVWSDGGNEQWRPSHQASPASAYTTAAMHQASQATFLNLGTFDLLTSAATIPDAALAPAVLFFLLTRLSALVTSPL